MTDTLTLIAPPPAPAVPVPRVPLTIRPAVAGDLTFIDSLQKKHTTAVGWMPTKQLEGKIAAGNVLVAEEMRNAECGVLNEERREASAPFSIHHSAFSIPPVFLGYCISRDQYFKRDDVGIVYQMNVAPDRQRGLVGAALLKAVFERAAYGCRLFCCWCAQDIEANYFWESMGFVPLAFRAGSREKGRVHIFWQRRIHAGDTTTPWWFPSQTTSGSLREDRLVLPIPPGTHWRDVKPVLLPRERQTPEISDQKSEVRTRKRPKPGLTSDLRPPTSICTGGLRFVAAAPAGEAPAKPKRQPKPKVKHDPRHVAAARELRDRFLEHVNADPSAVTAEGKYDVSRRIEHREAARRTPLLGEATAA